MRMTYTSLLPFLQKIILCVAAAEAEWALITNWVSAYLGLTSRPLTSTAYSTTTTLPYT